MTELDSTQAIPQPALRGGADERTCEVLLIRHGRSADVVPGSPESADPPLHEIGHEQAAALAARLAALEIHGVYSSHLRRAVETATPLAEQRGLEVGVRPDLEEIRLGEWSNGEFRRRAAALDPEWVAWSLTGRWDGIPGCEGDDALRVRVAAVIVELAQRHRGRRIAVVAHGGEIDAYVSSMFDVPRSLWMAVENTSITVVSLNDVDGAHVTIVNDCHHLDDPVTGAAAR